MLLQVVFIEMVSYGVSIALFYPLLHFGVVDWEVFQVLAGFGEAGGGGAGIFPDGFDVVFHVDVEGLVGFFYHFLVGVLGFEF